MPAIILRNIYSILALLVSGGVLGALVGALLQGFKDRRLQAASWKQSLCERILTPKLASAQTLYALLIAGQTPTDDQIEKVHLDQSEILLCDVPSSLVDEFPKLLQRFGNYRTFRESIQMLSRELLSDEAAFDDYFVREASESADDWGREVSIRWEKSGDRFMAGQVEAAGLGKLSSTDRWEKLKKEFQSAQLIKQELMQKLLQMMEALKGLILRVK